MRIRRISTLTMAIAVLVGCLPAVAGAEEIWTVRQGNTILSLNTGVLDQLGLKISAPSSGGAVRSGSALSFPIHPDSTLTFSIENGSLTDFLGGEVVHDGDLRFVGKRAPLVIEALQISMVRGLDKAQWVVAGPTGELGGLVLQRMKAGFNPATRTMTFHCPAVYLSAPLAEAMGDAALAGQSVGSLTIEASAEWLGGDEPSAESVAPMRDGGGSRMSGCDMTFCQLYGLYMPSGARLGDIVGLASGGTSWNLGDLDCIWYAMPNPNHPFIVEDMFRLKTVDGSERFEQIGQSWIKHGFYALGNTQCGGSCTFEPGHGVGYWLGQGCTDTYSPSLNAGQNGFGPRYELDPWTGVWVYAGSHNSQGNHGHNGIEHRLQVYDQDLNPAQNPGATYYTSQFYIMLDDVNVWNSAAWKPITVSGTPGGSWSFGMSGAGTPPEIGHPLNAWVGASRTVIAEEFPIIEFQSPDGRAVLLAKTTDLGGGTWHYEYALMNIDVDRKIDSFSIPILSGTLVTNIGFHAVHHHDVEVAGYSNDPWSAVVSSDAITWSTVDNPIRWSVLYNFRFDANQEPDPANVLAVLGLFEPGSPTELTGLTIGPQQLPPDCNNNGIPDDCDVDCGPPGGECDVSGCGGSEDCNSDGVPDECDPNDCNTNGTPDDCDIAAGSSLDCNSNGIPDECESNDCNTNGTPDDCDIAGGSSLDCNNNGVPDECDIDPTDPDGNGEVSEDCQPNGTPDECDPDGDADGVPDDCDNCPDDYNPGQEDEDGDGIGNACDPDFCDGIVLEQHFNVDPGWFVESFNLAAGEWEWGVPVGGGDRWDPPDDYDVGGACYLTENVDGDSDVDGGPTILYTEIYDLSTGGAALSYAYWFGSSADNDSLEVQMSHNGGADWTSLVTYTVNEQQWLTETIDIDPITTPTDQMQFRFLIMDQPNNSVLEGGIDAVIVTANCFYDCNTNGIDDACDVDCGEPGSYCDVPGCGTSPDCDANGTPDECEAGPIVPDGDMNGADGTNGVDIAPFIVAVLSASTDPVDLCHGDFSANGIIDQDDVNGMVSALLAP